MRVQSLQRHGSLRVWLACSAACTCRHSVTEYQKGVQQTSLLFHSLRVWLACTKSCGCGAAQQSLTHPYICCSGALGNAAGINAVVTATHERPRNIAQ
jgi:hypothetical protein